MMMTTRRWKIKTITTVDHQTMISTASLHHHALGSFVQFTTSLAITTSTTVDLNWFYLNWLDFFLSIHFQLIRFFFKINFNSTHTSVAPPFTISLQSHYDPFLPNFHSIPHSHAPAACTTTSVRRCAPGQCYAAPPQPTSTTPSHPHISPPPIPMACNQLFICTTPSPHAQPLSTTPQCAVMDTLDTIWLLPTPFFPPHSATMTQTMNTTHIKHLVLSWFMRSIFCISHIEHIFTIVISKIAISWKLASSGGKHLFTIF